MFATNTKFFGTSEKMCSQGFCHQEKTKIGSWENKVLKNISGSAPMWISCAVLPKMLAWTY